MIFFLNTSRSNKYIMKFDKYSNCDNLEDLIVVKY